MIAGLIARDPGERAGLLLAGAARPGDAAATAACSWARSRRASRSRPGQPDHLQRHRHPAPARQPRPARARLQVDRRGQIVARGAARRGVTSSSGASTARCSARPALLKRGRARAGPRAGGRRPAAAGSWSPRRAQRPRARSAQIEKDEIGEINYRIERARLRSAQARPRRRAGPRRATCRSERAAVERVTAEQQARYREKQPRSWRSVTARARDHAA